MKRINLLVGSAHPGFHSRFFGRMESLTGGFPEIRAVLALAVLLAMIAAGETLAVSMTQSAVKQKKAESARLKTLKGRLRTEEQELAKRRVRAQKKEDEVKEEKTHHEFFFKRFGRNEGERNVAGQLNGRKNEDPGKQLRIHLTDLQVLPLAVQREEKKKQENDESKGQKGVSIFQVKDPS